MGISKFLLSLFNPDEERATFHRIVNIANFLALLLSSKTWMIKWYSGFLL